MKPGEDIALPGFLEWRADLIDYFSTEKVLFHVKMPDKLTQLMEVADSKVWTLAKVWFL